MLMASKLSSKKRKQTRKTRLLKSLPMNRLTSFSRSMRILKEKGHPLLSLMIGKDSVKLKDNMAKQQT